MGFILNLSDAQQVLKMGSRIMVRSPKHHFRLDIWLIKSDYDRIAFKRRRQGILFGGRGWFASPEDTIIYKLMAGRSKDEEDNIAIMEVQRERLDWRYLLRWSKQMNYEKDLLAIRDKVKRHKKS